MTNILAIIPARGGSKGLPKKNILEVYKKPLIAWSIEASLQSKYITKTIVSSDNNEILSIAEQYGVETIKRPNKLATDNANTESVVTHALETLNKKYDYIILLQPTSPLRTSIHINEAFKIFFERDADALISVSSIDNKILKSFRENDKGFIEGIVNNQYPFVNRQSLPQTYISNGAIYIIKVDTFKKNNSFYTNKTIKYLMSQRDSLDVDSIEDLNLCEKFLKEINE